MNKRKYVWICAVCALFMLFAVIEHSSSTNYNILKVNNPFEIIVDYNNNGIIDEDETVRILKGYQYIAKENTASEKIAENLSLDEYSTCAFAYLTEKYANDILTDKKVCIKSDKNGKTILIGNENYNELLIKSGYLFKDNKPCSIESFNKRLNTIRKAEYKIYNTKSEKYHILTCKYGQKAHNYVILAKYQLPKGAKPCKYCLPEKQKSYCKKKIPPVKYVDNNSKITKCPPLIYTNGAVKMFLTDFTTKLIPDRYGNTALCNELVKQINSAKLSIDMAIYGYDRVPKIEKALKNAVSRGVIVRLVHDIDSNNSNIYAHTKEFAAFIKNSQCDRAPAGCQNPTLYTNSIMHDKFYIFDKSTVITGSANLSFTDMSGYNSNSVILIRSQKVADIYTREFEQMYNSKFHNHKTKISQKENVPLGNIKLSVYFSPKDLIIENVIIPLVNKSQNYIYMPVFLITDNRLAATLMNARNRGVDVRIIIDATNARSKHSKHRILRQHGVKVKTENYAGKLHSKSIIIDDKYTIIGSMNFSRSGNTKNDENLIVIEDKQMTVFYKTFFNYLWNRISDYWLTHDVSAEGIYSIGSCSDGIDNDYDGHTDLEDDGCKMIHK